MREPSGGEFAVEAAMAAKISSEREKGEYALTKALLTLQTHRGGGGGRGVAMGEMEVMAVWWSAREATVEVVLCSAALLGSTARARECVGEGESRRE